MTEEEMEAIIDLIKNNSDGALEAFARLSPAERDEIQARVAESSRQQTREKFQQWEADGTMDKIRARHAEKQTKKRKKKK